MEHFGPSHLVAIALTLAMAGAAVYLPRRLPMARSRLVSRLGAGILVAAWAWLEIDGLSNGFRADRDLPFHLSDWAVLVGVVALVTSVWWAVELIWFWGLAGASWAVLTPDISQGFESPATWAFFVTHSGVIVAAFYLVVGMRIYPRPGAVWRAVLFSLGVFLVAGVANLSTGGNYMFLREVPSQGSLLDVMGPWPWYLLSASALAVVLFLALYVPFRRRNGAL